MKFSDAIRAARRRAGLSQHQAADQSGVPFRTVQRIETGRYDCNRRTAMSLVEFFKLPPKTMLLP